MRQNTQFSEQYRARVEHSCHDFRPFRARLARQAPAPKHPHGTRRAEPPFAPGSTSRVRFRHFPYFSLPGTDLVF